MIRIEPNHLPKAEDRFLPLFAPEEITRVRRFHQSFPQYAVTPLAHLPRLAASLGIGGVFV